MASHLDQAADAIRIHSDLGPSIGIILGSGMGEVADILDDASVIPYRDIPGFPQSTAPSHKGCLHLGRVGRANVAIMQGRVHLYEGYDPKTVGFPVRVLRRLGVRDLILTNAAGGMNKDFAVGDLMLIHDHVSIASLAGLDPLRGANEDVLGSRFVSLNGAYDRSRLELASAIATECQIPHHRGVYGFVVGPSFETASEVRLLRNIGVDAVGMSTVPEVIVARHGEMRVVAVSGITNLSIADIQSEEQTTVEEVWDAVRIIVPRLKKLIAGMIKRIGV